MKNIIKKRKEFIRRKKVSKLTYSRKKKKKKKKRIVKIEETKSTDDLLFGGTRLTDEEYIKEKIKVEAFKKLKIIGTGYFSRVYLVQKKDTGKYYAMKMMNKKRIVKGNSIERIKRERNLLITFRNPFIVKLHYAFRDEEHLYLCMDYVPGGELFSHLRISGKFCESRARFYAAEIFVALNYLHQHNIIYRDLKPENIVMCKDGHLKLCDFGLSKILTVTEDRAFSFCGSASYIAPELLSLNDDYTVQGGYKFEIDWWAFGVLIYEMLFGNTPFHNRDVQDMYENILFDEIRFDPNIARISNEAKDIIRKLLVKDPGMRLGSRNTEDKIKNHPWFGNGVKVFDMKNNKKSSERLEKIDWEKITDQSLVPPFDPGLESSIDTKFVDPELLKIPVNQPMEMDENKEAFSQSLFDVPGSSFGGFSYENSFSPSKN